MSRFSKLQVVIFLVLLSLAVGGLWLIGGPKPERRPDDQPGAVPAVPALSSPAAMAHEESSLVREAVATRGPVRSEPTLRLAPEPAKVLIEESRPMTVEVRDISGLYGVDLSLGYNPRYLAVEDAEPQTPGVQVAPGAVFSEGNFFVVKNEVVDGVIHFVAARQAPAPAFEGDGPLFQINWQGLSLGESAVSFLEAKLAGPNGRSIEVIAEEAQVEVIPDLVAVQGQVILQGRPQPGEVTVQIAGQPVHTGPGGRFIATLKGVAGADSLRLTAPGCLSVEVSGLTSGDSGLIDLGQITMLGGELTGDDRIDQEDLSFIEARYGSYDARVDLNGDGLVDIGDLTPTLANFGQQGPIRIHLGAEAPATPPLESQPAPAQEPSSGIPATDERGQLVREWMQLLVERVQADKLSPPVASRIYAYGGITLYEAVVPGMPGYRSLQWQLNGLSDLPPVAQAPYHWPAVAASAMAEVTPALFTSPESQAAFKALSEQQLRAMPADNLPAERLERSVAYGRQVGAAIIAWMAADGYAESRSQPFASPAGPASWVPVGEQQPLEPHWGELRPFVMPSAEACRPPAPEAFSTDPASAFYRQAHQVYEVSQTLTEEQRATAAFWADNPGETGTPPGHWVSIANQLIEQQGLSLGEAAHMQALLGIGLADAFISCWHEKYEVFLIRPASYIGQYIEPGWQSLIPTPPFPEYPSGHSVASAAAAEILTELFGPISFRDETQAGRGLGSRTFDSFTGAAEEAAISRLYGGIHYPMAIEKGLAQGQCVGRMVVERTVTR